MAGESHKPVPSERGLKVNERLTIPEGELVWQFTRSGGPGGQHANTSDTRVDVRYDVTTSAVLSDHQRARLIEQFGDEARVMVDRHRSQWKNRVEARSQLAGRIRAALAPPKAPRRATRPTRGSKRRRLEAKRQQSEKKANRRRPPID
ncbi:alternative ribosome rescue aminoacyl-tRNA hydrolase ArfB [Candidatus Neomicrothrix sp.]|uniref:alternative ribosome rescue aminoacyl-tRNA hydrolase ArfB n=1 Tax=Candidatus Neomicrothrix sp. TaxID=2719034 RepID=UPI002596017D|nr:alternative ribosome rescue aminoacyl-tRNA hydrolase ArfB [Candidatus Microthrix sp.]HMS47005.1 alternative ribosome rescue aminoacyl-tRNA hydrolase ArfB [Candidatus Microthrix sp.]